MSMENFAIIISSLLIASACNPNNNPQPNGPGTNISMHWIDQWKNDTLVGMGQNPNGTSSQDNLDVLFTIKKGDTSMIKYKGVNYYVWTNRIPSSSDPNWYQDGHAFYGNLSVSTIPFDTASAVSNYFGNGVFPYRYKDNGIWITREWIIAFPQRHPPFASWVDGGQYYSQYKNLWQP